MRRISSMSLNGHCLTSQASSDVFAEEHTVFALFNIDNIYATILYFVITPVYYPLGVM